MDAIGSRGDSGNGNSKTRNNGDSYHKQHDGIVIPDYNVPARHSQASLAGPGRRQRRTCPSARHSFCNGSGGVDKKGAKIRGRG